ncbi:YkgJ family cysteine cluster protein [Chitinophaga pinensis]|uniref:YkgJ family cysteine cluster protein n=1 Tax=Chitinophaga pinensis (strain ATCC 43595 / DSM 2588 / LMG 13176 / NBRC 15968 / NCIMB 11800 / UQM 2034) TaxID=485918 RepID=A0A979G3Y8_CHIPD|nr:YkgJ family cysteine cluster protein [Chitinophaga pinensis]ACU60347.1 protein of unknown function UPF0153 [Chitinophaga pinensis DSM 2588]
MNANLAEIAAIAQQKEAENQSFKAYLKSQPADDIDQLVQELDALVTPQVDCTACGNCCRSLMINVEPDEVTRLAAHLSRTEADVIDSYIETGVNNSMMVINRIPCHFLENSMCTIYEHRFAGCREFPGLHLPQFTNRLFSMMMHYGTCPIIFNVLEEMKVRLDFSADMPVT